MKCRTQSRVHGFRRALTGAAGPDGARSGDISRNSSPEMSHARTCRAISAASAFLIEHSHTIATRQPACRRAMIFRLSRSTVSPNFFFQNDAFEAGLVAYEQFSCLCQKHPWTWIAARCFGRTMSGLPGRSFACSLYRSPRRCSARRRASSGFVSVPLMPAIMRDRVILSTISTISSFPGVFAPIVGVCSAYTVCKSGI